MCIGLVVVVEEDDIARLVRYSAQGYLELEKDKIFPEATDDITRRCIRYPSLDPLAAGPCPDTEIRDQILKYLFATYAVHCWVQHAKQNQEALTHEVISEVAVKISCTHMAPFQPPETRV